MQSFPVYTASSVASPTRTDLKHNLSRQHEDQCLLPASEMGASNQSDAQKKSMRLQVARLSISETDNTKNELIEKLLGACALEWCDFMSSKTARIETVASTSNDSLALSNSLVAVASTFPGAISAAPDVNPASNSSPEDHNVTGSKRRRRWSSAVIHNPLGKLKQGNSSTSTLIVPNKKKKSSKPVTFKLNYKTNQKPLSIKDIRDLVQYIFHDTNNSPNWITIENRTSLKQVIVLFTPGLLPEDFNLPKNSLFNENVQMLQTNHLRTIDNNQQMCKQICNLPLSAPGSKCSLFSAYNSFINVGLTKKEKFAKLEQLNKKRITINDLFMTIDELLHNEYPIHLDTPGLGDEYREYFLKKYQTEEIYKDWVDTTKFDHGGYHAFAIDCEMCLSKNGYVLTRVSVVDFECNLIYDKLVKPDVPIVDYLTRYSGITEDKLVGITTKLKDIQKDLLKIFSSTDILIGHSLHSDLNILKLRHPNVIDTSIIYEHKAGPPFKPALRYLADEYLNKKIQSNEVDGHDSFEDAVTCMELTKLKLINGLTFGIGINTENLFQRLNKQGVKSITLGDSFLTQCKPFKNSARLETSLKCESDEEVIQSILSNINGGNLFVGRMRELEYAREFVKLKSKDYTVKSVDEAVKNLGDRLQRLYEACPVSTMIIVCSGNGDPRDWVKLMREFNELDKEEKAIAKKERDEEIQYAVSKARDAVTLLMIKQ